MTASARLAPLLLTGLALVGCSSPPPQPEQPPLTVPAQFGEAQRLPGWARAQPGLPELPTDWWQLFQDPTLSALQTQVMADNANLQLSAAQVRAAQAALGSSQAGLWPSLGLGASASRARAASGSGSNANPVSTSYSLSAQASWEPDLWGRLSGAVDVARQRLDASRDDLAAARLSLQTLVAQTYFAMRHAEAQGRAVDAAVAAYERSLALTEHRHRAGVAHAGDVAQAQTQLKTAQVQQLELRTQRAQLAHSLATLAGQPSGWVQWPETAQLPQPPTPPALLPAQLLQRRPDISAAQRRVAAAKAQVGVSEAAFYPSLTLGASSGSRASHWSDLLSAPQRLWSWGPSLVLAALDGGSRQAAREQALAGVDQATASYRQTVLTAFQEVEDNLVATAHLQDEHRLQTEGLAAARRALALAEAQYKAGTVSYLSVISAQTAALSSERSLLDLRYRRLVATAQLLKNAAGPWTPPRP